MTIFAWFALVLWGLSYLLEQRLVWFDEKSQLLELGNNGELAQPLVTELVKKGFSVSGSVFHISSENCNCNWRSAGHTSSVKRQVTESGGRNYSIDIDQFNELKRFVPATPAIIM
ncbi:MAG TPA: thioredoxin, partial [Idiomarina abyssalis]|nr:thioredoxin [Idiomarina abyssalis]